MTYLLQLHIGPVQGFIATARRTRDLWYGSYLLSEISKAVAHRLAQATEAKLIFPFARSLADLEPDSPLPVVNLVVAEVNAATADQAFELGEKAREAARAHWRSLCEKAMSKLASSRPGASPPKLVRMDIWKAQLDDVLELYSAVVPLEAGQYSKSMNDLRALMASRKSFKNATALSGEPAGLPKSSLDGQRSTVMHEDDGEGRSFWRQWRRKLGVEPGEHLDLAGLVKRVQGREASFVPVGRMALVPWLDKLGPALAAKDAKGSAWQAFTQAASGLVGVDAGSGLHVGTYPWAAAFPFDGQMVYVDRRARARPPEPAAGQAEADATDADLRVKIDAFAAALNKVCEVSGVTQRPSPYYALLLADGDRMGELVDAATDADEHRQISVALAEFAATVPELVNGPPHDGACIYSGGDDVLALLRVDRALVCADALRQKFASLLNPRADALNARRKTQGLQALKPPTLSVGVAICHMLDPLGDTREWAKEAETLAKNGLRGTPLTEQRNALGVVVKPRGGGPLAIRMRWDDAAARQQLETFQRYFTAEELPAGLPYELRDAWDWCKSIFDPDKPEPEFEGLWKGRVRVLLSKKRRPRDEEPLDSGVARDLHQMLIAGRPAEQRACLDRLMVARWLTGQATEGR
jgi:CRISPR-associated protein Cmr2